MRRIVLARRSGVSFDLTPMIDVIFLLVIFFLCVNQHQRVETSVEVSLPEASSPAVHPPGETTANRLVIQITPDGAIRIGRQQWTVEELPEFLEERQQAAKPRSVEVWLRADRRVPYAHVEPILLACAETGLWDVHFKVVRPPGDRP